MYFRFATIMICATGLSGCASHSQSCCGASDSQAKSCCGEQMTARDNTPRTVNLLEHDLAPLRDSFNAKADRWRAVALVSPTCSECIYGAEAVRKEITDRFSADHVETISVWIPMLPPDNEQAARESASIFPPDGVPQFYDSQQKVGWAYSRGTFAEFINRARKSLPAGHYLAEHFDNPQMRDRPQWDLYMLYAPGIRWGNSPPMPNHWIRHCGRTDGQKSTYWVDSPDTPPREGNLFDAMREMADKAISAKFTDASSPMSIELLGFPSCPNTPAIRKSLESALRALNRESKFVEVNLESLSPSDARLGWGAPTILINGRDLMGMPPTSRGLSCRAYPGGVPSAEEVSRRLKLAIEQVQPSQKLLIPATPARAVELSDAKRQIVFSIRGFT